MIKQSDEAVIYLECQGFVCWGLVEQHEANVWYQFNSQVVLGHARNSIFKYRGFILKENGTKSESTSADTLSFGIITISMARGLDGQIAHNENFDGAMRSAFKSINMLLTVQANVFFENQI